MNGLVLAYDVLSKIYKEDAFSSIEINRRVAGANNQAVVTRLVYGVLQKDIELDYYISALVEKKPNKTILILLKLGIYSLKYMDSFPDYAVVDEVVTLCEKLGKKQLKGFVNGVLKQFIAKGKSIDLPKDRSQSLSVEASVPLWLVKAYVKQYGYEKTREFLLIDDFTKEHIRNNNRYLSLEQLKALLDKQGIDYIESKSGGLFVNNNKYIKELGEKGQITYQSMTSMLAVQSLDLHNGQTMLDLCSAPGGKSVYASELADIKITACDIHEHRIELIKSYAARMGAKSINTQLLDASVYNQEFANKFDRVLCDVPCSGFGVARKKPDIYLRASMEKVQDIAKTQYAILLNAGKYIKDNGKIVYSTCTLLREENYNIVGRFVKENPDFRITQHTTYLPDGNGTDGFFIAILEKK